MYKRAADFISEPTHIGTNSLKRYEPGLSKCLDRVAWRAVPETVILLMPQGHRTFFRHGEVISRLPRVNHKAKGSAKGWIKLEIRTHGESPWL
ncbi:MAG: hypothetical protein E6Q28_09755 [Afipia sp.]|nr:MAG: hypothetical protein E6Q28_09755 [Afipia sp.]